MMYMKILPCKTEHNFWFESHAGDIVRGRSVYRDLYQGLEKPELFSDVTLLLMFYRVMHDGVSRLIPPEHVIVCYDQA